MTKDADFAVIAMGTITATARHVVEELRKQGKKVGLIKVKTFRPFPEEEIIKATENLKAIAILDRSISFGQHGTLFSEIRSALQHKDIIVNNFIVGLGGRDVTPDHIKTAFEKTIESKQTIIEWLF